MTKRLWLLVGSPTIVLLILLPLDLVPPNFSAIYVALAFLQGLFLLGALKRVRRTAPNSEGERFAMPLWQKIVLSAIAIYGLLLVLIGALTKQ